MHFESLAPRSGKWLIHGDTMPGFTTSDIVEPRTSTIKNTAIFNRGFETALVAPDQNIVKAIISQSEQVRYLPTVNHQDFQTSSFGFDMKGTTPPNYKELILYPFIQQVQVDFPDKRLAFRAITTSINGCYSNGEMCIMDITRTAAHGTEKRDSETRVAILDPEYPDSVRIIAPYIFNAGIMRSNEAKFNPQTAKALFPAVLAYDTSKLEARQVDASSRLSEALLATYILDSVTDYAATLEPTYYGT